MRAIAIRHAKVDLAPPKGRITGAEFEEYLSEYEKAPIVTVTEQHLDIHRYSVYVSASPRTEETASELFKQKDWTTTPLLGEVPMKAFTESVSASYPLWYWMLRARLQWYFNDPRQPETRTATYERCGKLMHLIRSSDRGTVLVSHGFFLRVFLSYCRRNHYEVTRYGGLTIAPLERIRITERDAHCGHCVHNCLLSNPGCDIGRETAALGRSLL